jgi:hypothetical protein
MAGFPTANCRVLASVTEGDAAYVVMDTGPVEYRYLYGGTAERVEGGWIDGTSGNGPGAGWTRTDREGELGVAYIYDEAPEGVDRVRVAFGTELHEAAVINGIYLAAWWRVPSNDARTPVTAAFRVAGEWMPAKAWRGVDL